MSPEALLLARPAEHPPSPSPVAVLRTTPVRRRRPSEGLAVFVVAAVAYGALGVWLVLAEGVVFVDSLARVGNALYVVGSRDPHLSAVGFVWNPLPSLVMIPLVELRLLWPALVREGLAANITAALAMAGALSQVALLLRDAGLGRAARLTLTAALALHPLIALYGANGMSEAWLLLALTWASRRLHRWLQTGAPADLVPLALALALAYLCRYEAVAAAAAVVVVVGVQSWRSSAGAASGRRSRAGNDVLLVVLPFTATFLGWAAVSWAVVGHPFETFTSPYGNEAQVAGKASDIVRDTGADAAGRLRYVAEQVAWLTPALAVLVPVGLLAAVRRRTRPLLAPVAVLGSVLAMQAAAFLHGSTFGWLRFSITAVPLAVLVAGMLAARVARPVVRAAAVSLAVLVSATACVTAWHPVLDPRLGREESEVLLPVLHPAAATPENRFRMARYANDRAVAGWLDAQQLRRGTVLVDTAQGFGVVIASARPDQFVVTSDRDFQAAVADPVVYDVEYLLTQPSPLDALNATYPGLYERGAPFLRLVREFPRDDPAFPWRLYRVGDRFFGPLADEAR